MPEEPPPTSNKIDGLSVESSPIQRVLNLTSYEAVFTVTYFSNLKPSGVVIYSYEGCIQVKIKATLNIVCILAGAIIPKRVQKQDYF